MKLYTEEEVRELADMIQGHKTDELMSSLTPIELPTDEEIEKEIKLLSSDLGRIFFAEGIEWVLDKIKGGNK